MKDMQTSFTNYNETASFVQQGVVSNCVDSCVEIDGNLINMIQPNNNTCSTTCSGNTMIIKNSLFCEVTVPPCKSGEYQKGSD